MKKNLLPTSDTRRANRLLASNLHFKPIMKKSNFYSLLAAILIATGLNAQQVTIKTPDMTVEPNANVHVDVLVEDFQKIIGAQFSLNWNKSVLQYVGVDNFGLPNMETSQNFGTLQVNDGKLRFSWVHDELTGVTVPNMDQVFSIWFKAIGAPGSSTDLMLSDDPIPVELTSTDSIVPTVGDNGTITLTGTSATTESLTPDFTLFQNNPNPFSVVTYINFRLEKTEPATLIILDQSGKKVMEKTGEFSAGLNSIPVNRDIFQSSGNYLYTLKTANATATRQLTVQ